MPTLRDYFYGLDQRERERFAKTTQTSVGYIQQLINHVRATSVEMAMRMEVASGGKLRAEVLAPDAPWREWKRLRQVTPTRQPTGPSAPAP